MGGRRSQGRDISGVLLVDKPLGLTSNKVLQHVKRLYNAKKAGHTGSLDPMATGMLPVCLGEATKFAGYLLDADKTYEVVAKLGLTTETGDAEGAVVEKKPVPQLPFAEIEAILSRFLGETEQVPSMYSALKHQGVPLYKLAREGITVERQPRKITVYNLVVHEVHPDTVRFTVRCSKGTYVRSLVEDFGALAGCGAHVAALRRTEVAGFSAEQMVRIDTLQSLAEARAYTELDAMLLPVEDVLAGWNRITVDARQALSLHQGRTISVPNAATMASGFVVIMQHHEGHADFLGVGEVNEAGEIVPRRLIKAVGP